MTTSAPPQVNEKLLKVTISALGADVHGGQPLDESHIIDTVRTYAPLAGKGLSESEILAVIEELTRRFNVWTGKAGTLVGEDPGHQVWLPGRRADMTWH